MDLSLVVQSRQQFLELVSDVRPALHRYCARMTGSVADGEDIVQDALAKAYFALPDLAEIPDLRKWLFAIAHRRAIDHLRRYEQRHREELEDLAAEDDTPEDRASAEEAARLAIRRFGELPPAQRSVVILKDVIGHSVSEIAELVGLGEAAVKSLLHRGRVRLRSTTDAAVPTTPSPFLERYAALFNARDWEGVRALLAADVRLDLVGLSQREGKADVGSYFTNYASKTDYHFVASHIDGRPALLVERDPPYLVELGLRDGQITLIKDYRYVPYVMQDAEVRF